MALRQVHHMDIIPHTGTVRGRPVTSKHMEHFQFPRGYLCNIGNQIVGDPGRVLSNQPGGMGADGIKVPQQSHIQFRSLKVTIKESW